jgi:hypothetical protein
MVAFAHANRRGHQLYQDDWPLAHGIYQRRELLRALREQAGAEALQNFVRAARGHMRREFARAHPELFYPEIAYGLAYVEQSAPDAKTRQFLAPLSGDRWLSSSNGGPVCWPNPGIV